MFELKLIKPVNLLLLMTAPAAAAATAASSGPVLPFLPWNRACPSLRTPSRLTPRVLWIPVIIVLVCEAPHAGTLGEHQDGDGDQQNEDCQDNADDDADRAGWQCTVVIRFLNVDLHTELLRKAAASLWCKKEKKNSHKLKKVCISVFCYLFYIAVELKAYEFVLGVGLNAKGLQLLHENIIDSKADCAFCVTNHSVAIFAAQTAGGNTEDVPVLVQVVSSVPDVPGEGRLRTSTVGERRELEVLPAGLTLLPVVLAFVVVVGGVDIAVVDFRVVYVKHLDDRPIEGVQGKLVIGDLQSS